MTTNARMLKRRLLLLYASGCYLGALWQYQDFYNFKTQLEKLSNYNATNSSSNQTQVETTNLRQCADVESELLLCCGVQMFNDNRMRSYVTLVDIHTGKVANSAGRWSFSVLIVALISTIVVLKRPNRKKKNSETQSLSDRREMMYMSI